MKPNNRQLTINGLTRCGWQIVPDAKAKLYLVFRHLVDGRTFFVGRAGALRVSRTATASDSVSLTNSKLHRAFREVGEPGLNLTAEQAAAIVNQRVLTRYPLLNS